MFKKELDEKLLEQEEIISGLSSMTSHDLSILQGHGFSLNLYIEEIHDQLRNKIFLKWLEKAESDCHFAYGLFRWAVLQKLTMSEDEISKIIQYAVPAITESKRSRNEFWELPGVIKIDGLGEIVTSHWNSFGRVAIPEAILSARKQDQLEDQREQENQVAVARQAEIERGEYLEGLKSLPLYEKLKALKFGRKVYFSDLQSKPDFLLYTTSDLASLDATKVQQLIDWCSSEGFYWQEILPKLYDRRHQIRLDAVNQVRENLKAFPVECWLDELLPIESIPIEHYPAELTAYATSEWLASHDQNSRSRFLDLLCKTNLRIWKKVEARLANK